MDKRMTDERLAEIEDSGALTHTEAVDLAHEAIDTLKAERDRIAELEALLESEDGAHTMHINKLEAQIEDTKGLVALYFEGCDCDTFDDQMRELRVTLAGAG
jgi:hypothetical protein